MAEKTVTVQKNPENPEPDIVIAEHLRLMADFMARFDAGPLKRETLVILIREATGVPKRDINLVLNALASLKSQWLKAKK